MSRTSRAGLVAAQRQFDAAQASLRQAEANDLKAQDDVNRYKPLAAKDEIPQQLYTQAVESQKATAAAVEAARASAAAAEQAVTQARAKVAQAQARIAIRRDPAATDFRATLPRRSGGGGDPTRQRGLRASSTELAIHDHRCAG